MNGSNNQQQQPANPWRPMDEGSTNVHNVTYGGQTRTVTGANCGSDAARQAFGSNGNYARVVTTQTTKWM